MKIMQEQRWFWVQLCEECNHPILLDEAPRLAKLPHGNDTFVATCSEGDCGHSGTYRRNQIERRRIGDED